MKKILIAFAFFLLPWLAHSQIGYSRSIPTEELKVLKNVEVTLKKLPFTLPSVIDDSGRLSAKDSVVYSKIFFQFFDTAQIQLLRTRQTNYLKIEEEAKWLQGMTISAVIGIHNVITCLPDSILFVMPANEYNLLDKDDDRVRYGSDELLVAGYKAGDFYYPMFSILFSKLKRKIVYINFLINFERYPREKEDYFNSHLHPILIPCVRKFSEDYGNGKNAPAIPKSQDTTRVLY